MENASKALIIAGAILLSILLISLGIMVFNQAQGVIDGSGMDAAELQSFNSKFVKYEGEKKGSEIRALAQEIIANNANENDYQITCEGELTGEKTQIKVDSKLRPNKIYVVELTYGTVTGRVEHVKVTPKTQE